MGVDTFTIMILIIIIFIIIINVFSFKFFDSSLLPPSPFKTYLY